jgi:II/X family phage/plasmid replication protein
MAQQHPNRHLSMLLDWLTARIPYEAMNPEIPPMLRALGDRIQRINPVTGQLVWETSAWDSVRSDSHGVVIRPGSDALWIQGSPARVIGDGCAVFGSGAAAALDLPGCLSAMVRFVSTQLSIILPSSPSLWIVSRIDITQNLLLDSLESVRQSLRLLRDCEGGRYRVSQQAGDTVYWSSKSKYRSGKAYAKGPHLVYQNRNAKYNGKVYTDFEIAQANRLLRLELKLGTHFFTETASVKWYELTADMIRSEWENYFNRMIGSAEMKTESDLRQKVFQVAPTKGQGQAAYSLWLLIQAEGWQKAKDYTTPRTWYRNIKILHSAGLGDLDLSAGKIVPFRQKIIECVQVNSWAELRKLAA